MAHLLPFDSLIEAVTFFLILFAAVSINSLLGCIRANTKDEKEQAKNFFYLGCLVFPVAIILSIVSYTIFERI
jgi:hypothetical protein